MSRGPEAERQRRITDALSLYDWLWVHYRTSVDPKRGGAFRTALDGDKGAPDLLAVHAKRALLLFVENKANKGRLSPEQKLWKDALEAVSIMVGVGLPRGDWYGHFGYFLCDSDQAERDLLAIISGGRL